MTRSAYSLLKNSNKYMKNYLSEYIGTTFLLMIVVGSGIMGQSLSDNNSLTLLANTIATGAGLIVLIWMFGNISGAPEILPNIHIRTIKPAPVAIVLARRVNELLSDRD